MTRSNRRFLVGLLLLPLLTSGCSFWIMVHPIKLHPTKDSSSPNGLYQPKDLDDAVQELGKTLPWTERLTIWMSSADQMDRYISLHHRLGMGLWIRNQWIRSKGSPLNSYFKMQEIENPDSMSGIILEAYWCHVHHRAYNLQAVVKFRQKLLDDRDVKGNADKNKLS